MAYNTERDTVGREAFTRVEIDMPTCALTYGSAPCTASGGVGNECRNTRNTCQDTANYDGSTVNTIIICDEGISIPGVPMLPLILSGARGKVLSPTRIDKKKALGKRAEIRLTCRDQPMHDRNIDPYAGTRTYTAEEQGTFWGKVKAIFKYYQGAEMRVITGYIAEGGYNAADSITRYYILDEIDGPKKDGHVILTGRDVIKLADDKRALCPLPTSGKLAVALTAGSTTSFTLTNGAGDYPTGGGKIRFEDEVIEYTSGSDSGDDFIVAGTITRGASNTDDVDHDAGSTGQNCKVVNDNVIDFVVDLLTNFGNVPTSYITTADWNAVRDEWFNGSTITQDITKPEGVTKLIEQLNEQYLFKIWSDVENQKVRLQAVAPLDAVTTNWTDSNTVLDKGVIVTEKTDDRISRILVHYNPRTPVEFDKEEHFHSHYLHVSDSEDADKHGDIRIKEIFARFITGEGQAVRCAGRTLNIFKDVPKEYEFFVDAKDTGIVTGDAVNLVVPENQDVDGSTLNELMQIISTEETEVGHKYKYRAIDTTFAGRYGRIMPSGSNDYGSATDDELATGAYISPSGGGNFADGGLPYKII